MNASSRVPKRRVAGTFFSGNKLDSAIKALLDNGFEKDQIDMLCTEETVRDKLKQDYVCIGAIADDEDATRFVEKEGTASTVSATIGGLSLAGGAIGGGAIIASAGLLGGPVAVATAASTVAGGLGALAGAFISKSDVDILQDELNAGHILLLVQTEEGRQKDTAERILTEVSEIKARVLEPASPVNA